MATRLLICSVLVTLAAIALVGVTVESTEVRRSEVIASLATEALGIFVTVGFVDLLLERDRRREKAKVLAWNALNALDHAVWVWQGGSRRFDPGELVGLIQLVEMTDPLPEPTENLLLRLGEMSQNTLQMKDPAVAKNEHLLSGLEALSRLSFIRDTVPSMSHKELQRHLSEAVVSLLQTVGLHTTAASRHLLLSVRDASEARQRYRLYGERITMPAA